MHTTVVPTDYVLVYLKRVQIIEKSIDFQRLGVSAPFMEHVLVAIRNY